MILHAYKLRILDSVESAKFHERSAWERKKLKSKPIYQSSIVSGTCRRQDRERKRERKKEINIGSVMCNVCDNKCSHSRHTNIKFEGVE